MTKPDKKELVAFRLPAPLVKAIDKHKRELKRQTRTEVSRTQAVISLLRKALDA